MMSFVDRRCSAARLPVGCRGGFPLKDSIDDYPLSAELQIPADFPFLRDFVNKANVVYTTVNVGLLAEEFEAQL